jgi:N-acetylglucosamine-6-phosphate deacetylase
MSEVRLRAHRVHTPDESSGPAVLGYDPERGIVTSIDPDETQSPALHDLRDHLIVPGFVDVHTHGGNGLQVNGEDAGAVAEAVLGIARHLGQHGTTSFLATTVTDSPDRLLATVEGVALAMREQSPGARIAGVHLEGPWLARARLGAQDPTQLRRPDPDELGRLLAAGGGAVRIITLAPELPGAFELIDRGRSAGVVVALGHTDADYETAERAFARGATHVTHLFNAMAPLHHRRPGIVGAALTTPRITLELIADLEHVHPAVLRLVMSTAPERVVAVSDSVPAAGLEAGRHRLGGLDITVSGRRVELADSPATLAGSVLSMGLAVGNLVRIAAVPFADALRAATKTPGSLLAGGPFGRLVPEGPADFAILDLDLGVVATVVRGRAVYDPSGLLS